MHVLIKGMLTAVLAVGVTLFTLPVDTSSAQIRGVNRTQRSGACAGGGGFKGGGGGGVKAGGGGVRAGGGGFRGGGQRFGGGPRRGFNPGVAAGVGAAAIGLGILGAAAASQQPVYDDGYYPRRRYYNGY